MNILSNMLEAVLPNHKVVHCQDGREYPHELEMCIGMVKTEGVPAEAHWVIQRVAADPQKSGEWYIRKLYFDSASTLNDCFWGYCPPVRVTIVRVAINTLVRKIITFWGGDITPDAISVATEAGVKWLQQRRAQEFVDFTICIRKDVVKAYSDYETGCHSCMTGNDSVFTEVYQSCNRVALVEISQAGRYLARFITVKLEPWPTWDDLPEDDNPLNPEAKGWRVVRVYPFPRHDREAEEKALKFLAQQTPWLTTFSTSRPNGGVGGLIPDHEYLPYLDMAGHFWIGQGKEEGRIVLCWGECAPPAGEGRYWSSMHGDNHTGGNLAQPPESEYEYTCCSCDDGMNDDDCFLSPDGSSYCQGCFDERWITDWRGRTIEIDDSLIIMGGCYSQCQCNRRSIPEDYILAWDCGEEVDCVALIEDCLEIGDTWYYNVEEDDVIQAKTLNWNPTTQLWDVGDEEKALKTPPSGYGYITTIPSTDGSQYYMLPQRVRVSRGTLTVSVDDNGAATILCGTWTVNMDCNDPATVEGKTWVLKRWHGINTGSWHWVLSEGQDALPSYSIQWRFEVLDIRNFSQYAPNTESEVSNA